MPLPVDVRTTHTNEVPALVIDTKTLLNMLRAAARSDSLTPNDRIVLSEELAGMWEQIVDISNLNRAGLDRLEEAQDTDGKETSAAEIAAQAA